MRNPEEFCLGVVTGATLMFIAGAFTVLMSMPSPARDTFETRWPSSKGDKLKVVPYLEYRSERSQDGFCWPHYACLVS